MGLRVDLPPDRNAALFAERVRSGGVRSPGFGQAQPLQPGHQPCEVEIVGQGGFGERFGSREPCVVEAEQARIGAEAAELGGDDQRKTSPHAVATRQQYAGDGGLPPDRTVDDEPPNRRRPESLLPVAPPGRLQGQHARLNPVVQSGLERAAQSGRDEIAMRRHLAVEADPVDLGRETVDHMTLVHHSAPSELCWAGEFGKRLQAERVEH